MLKVHNTLTKKKEEFKPLEEGNVSLYTCGPTVYNYPHIGNYRAYMFGDILKRYLKYSGYKVNHIMNLTDVDDKTIRDSQKAHMPLKTFTDQYIKVFFEDLETLNIEKASQYPRATDYIPEMVELIKILLEKGYAYKGEDNSIYFNIRKFKHYGKLSGIKLEELEEDASGRVKNDEYDKENAQDFALWKAYDEKDGDVFWETEIGKGRPGWHIECSAMSMKLLGHTFDFHTGGFDNMFPHHENEIAQSEAATGKPFVKYWMHCQWLLVDNKKMAKSSGTFYTLRDILEKGYSPRAIRYLLLATHYKQSLNFTFEGLKASQTALNKIKEFMIKLEEPKEALDSDIHQILLKAETEFEECMDDDLNTSGALAAIFDLIREINKLMDEEKISQKNAEQVLNVMREFDKVFGVFDFSNEIEEIPAEITKLAEERQQARKTKDFKKSDELRDILKSKGYSIDDTPNGIRIKKI